MHSATKRKPTALVVRDLKSAVASALRMCRMDPISHCGRVLDPNGVRNRGIGKRECCDSCYALSCESVRNNHVKEQELVDAGYWAQTRRGFQKRLLNTMLARRQAS